MSKMLSFSSAGQGIIMAVGGNGMASASVGALLSFIFRSGSNLWTRHLWVAPLYTIIAEQRTELAQTGGQQSGTKLENIV